MGKIGRAIIDFSFGVWDIGKENLMPFVSKVVERGEQRRIQHRGSIVELTVREEAFLTRIKELTQRIVKEMRLTRQQDLRALEKRVADLEEILSSCQADQASLDWTIFSPQGSPRHPE